MGGGPSTTLFIQRRLMKIKEMSIDLETYSEEDLSKCGVYKYAESDSFQILLFGVSINNGPVTVFDIASGDKLTESIIDALVDETIIKWAFNASFERICLSYWLKKNYPDKFESYGSKDDTTHNYLNPVSWRCTMIWSAYMGLPLSLAGVGKVLNLEEQKLKEGKDLIRYFCTPCKPTKANGGRTRNLPYHAKEKWELFKSYNKRDVEVEMSIKEKLHNFPVPEFIWNQYHLDQQINDRGIMVDLKFVRNAIRFDAFSKMELTEKLQQLTSLENPNSVVQLKDYLKENGLETESLGKKQVNELLKDAPSEIKEILELRQQLAKSSVKKYQAMNVAVCKDNRCRGMFQFYGANRTGRWAGRLIQLQNLPQNHMSDLKEARDLVKSGDYESLSILYDDIPSTLSELIRTSFVAKPGYKFYVADFSAIEARVIAHLARETWREDVFKNGGDIYCASASQMFHVPVKKHGINGHLRQKGKIAELALGYGGSVGALKAMGALDMGLQEDELQPLVDAWRESNPNIVELWWDVDEAIKDTVKSHLPSSTHGIKFEWTSGMLFIILPSGRKLTYVKPRIGENQFGGESVTYEGIGSTKKWERLESYGPKFVENIVQAISRDILMNSITNMKDLFICGHVHDELLIECKEDVSLIDICNAMSVAPTWMQDIQLRADGYVTEFYKKD